MKITDIPDGDIVSLLFQQTTYNEVEKLFENDGTGIKLGADWSNRLQKIRPNKINLQSRVNSSFEIEDENGRKKELSQSFFRLIGSYEKSDDTISIRIPFRFHKTANLLTDKSFIEKNIPILSFEPIEDALIGAHSLEALNFYYKRKDGLSLTFNGIQMNILQSDDMKYSQCLLTDRTGKNKPLSIFSNSTNSFKDLTDFSETIKKLYSDGILDSGY